MDQYTALTPDQEREFRSFFVPTPAPELQHSTVALTQLQRDVPSVHRDFKAAAPAVPPKRKETPEEFKERLREYKRKHPNRDFGRRRRR